MKSSEKYWCTDRISTPREIPTVNDEVNTDVLMGEYPGTDKKIIKECQSIGKNTNVLIEECQRTVSDWYK